VQLLHWFGTRPHRAVLLLVRTLRPCLHCPPSLSSYWSGVTRLLSQQRNRPARLARLTGILDSLYELIREAFAELAERRSGLQRNITAASMACRCAALGLTPPTVGNNQPASPVTRKPLRMSSCARSLACTAAKLPSVSTCQQPQLQSCRSARVVASPRCHTFRQRRPVLTKAYNQKPDIADRVVASVPYLIPLCDGLRYGECSCVYMRCSASFLAQLNPTAPFLQESFSLPSSLKSLGFWRR